MFRITEQENKQIRKMYGLILEATETDCKTNILEFREFRLWCSLGDKCRSKGYKIKSTVKDSSGKYVDNICQDTELMRAYNNPEFYNEFKKWNVK